MSLAPLSTTRARISNQLNRGGDHRTILENESAWHPLRNNSTSLSSVLYDIEFSMPAPQQFKLGILVPSSNTALEPLTTRILSSTHPRVTAHFSRFPVTQISLSPTALAQFNVTGPITHAARLLADAHVDVIGWSGTSGGWLGFDVDEKLCRAIADATGGIPATTSTLALNRALALLGVTGFGLVTPYTDDVQRAIVANYTRSGFAVWESHLGIRENLAIAEVGEDVLDGQVREVVEKGGGKVQAVTTFCTNLTAAQRVERWESQHGVPVLDTVTAVVWDCLRILGCDYGEVKGWGRIFEL